MPVKSAGTELQLEVASVFTPIASLVSIEGPDPNVESEDVTTLETTTGREYELTDFVAPGKVSASGFFDPVAATLKNLTALITAPAIKNWKLVWGDAGATAWPFAGFLESHKPKAEVGQMLKHDFGIQLDGIVTYPT